MVLNVFFSEELLLYFTKDHIKDLIPIFMAFLLMGIIVYFSGKIAPNNILEKLVAKLL